MITNLRRRTAMAAAGLGAALGLGILLVPTVDAHLANGSMSEVMMSEIAGLLSSDYPLRGDCLCPQRRVGQSVAPAHTGASRASRTRKVR